MFFNIIMHNLEILLFANSLNDFVKGQYGYKHELKEIIYISNFQKIIRINYGEEILYL